MRTAFLALVMILAGAAAAQAQVQAQARNGGVPELVLDHETRINGIGMACTGVGSDSRVDPRWNDYSLKLEFAGAHGEFLGFVDVTLNRKGHELVHVRCPGPWLLFQLPPGRYGLSAWVGRQPAKFNALVRPHGQARVVVHIPD